MNAIRNWLEAVGLSQYAGAFEANDIDMDLLRQVDDQTLKDIGVSIAGHRLRIRNAITKLGPAAVLNSKDNAAGATGAASAERRQLTVMFCDLVGSTALSSRLDPEDLREVIGAYHRCVAETVARFDGFVAKYMGDGLLVYFGYPQAHEDDAERAVRAGLAVIDAVAHLAAPRPLRVRLGIASGLAVVGDLIGAGAAQERGIVGETPNLAARLQALAAPNTLVISESTRRQVGALFEIEDLGRQPLAGFAEPQRAWRVFGESGVLSRFEALRAASLTPLVGREEEIELLRRRWRRAAAGEGLVVLICGEPGIGKSRLTAALRERLESEDLTRLRYFCAPHHQDSALYPFISQLERAAGFEREDLVETKLDKLEALLAPASPPAEEVGLVAELLSLPAASRYPSPPLTPQRKKEKTFAALLRQLEALARRTPVLMVFEDLHWIDPSSRELLDRTIERIASLPVLLLATFRPEFAPPWSGLPQVTVLTLARLDRRIGAAMVAGIAGNAALSSEAAADIVERADGIPLFVEELTRAVLEGGGAGARVEKTLAGAASPAAAVPAVLHAPLMARLDRLGQAPKEIAQIAAAIGREFPYELLAPVAERSEGELLDALGRLGEAGLVFCRGTPPHATYLFKHALVRDAAYGSLLRRRREELHARIAAVLEADFADRVAAEPELLARHLTDAGLLEKAVSSWLRAGERATERSANREAIAHFRKALDILGSLPDSPQRDHTELNLQMALGSALTTTGFAAPEKEQAFARARQLADRLGEGAGVFRALWYLGEVHASRGEPLPAYDIGQECLRIAESASDPRLLLGAHQLIGESSFWLGRLLEGSRHLDQALALYDPERDRDLVTYYGMDRFGLSCGLAAWAQQILGAGERALGLCNAGLTRARELSHTFSIVFTLMTGAGVCVMQRDPDRMRSGLAELLPLCAEHGYHEMWRWAEWMSGWAAFYTTGSADAIAQSKAALRHFDHTGGSPGMPWHKGLLAEMYACAGMLEEARSALGEASEASRISEQHFYDAELYRIAGQIALAAGVSDLAAAEQSFRTAIDDARDRKAKCWELRAATSLARLLARQGRSKEARDLLAPVYGWFTEGFDTADLKDAKSLLDGLA